jgi:DNA mismatch repair protein MutL
MPIHILPPDVASKIAAGEVVERPANVVKELVENCVDAGATEIRVETREGGRRLLRISDNGHGIPAAEAPLAFERHATSKLNSVDDLSHIATFGFRGEALYSIAAVSQLTFTTRSYDEEFGIALRLEGGVLQSQSRAGAPVGTVVAVEHLFYNVPARQKFLRAAATEAGQISWIVQRFALAYPDRRFSHISDGRLLFQSSGSGDLFDVLVKVYGLENARQMVPVGLPPAAAASTGAPAPAVDVDFMADVSIPPIAPGLRRAPSDPAAPPIVTGYVSLPSLTRANRSAIDLFVNRRYVEDRTLTHAVVQAYHTLLPGGRYPVAALFVDIAPSEVDVNVHPQKTQVRFVEERRVYGALQKAVRRAIVAVAPVPDVTIDEAGRVIPATPPPTGTLDASGWASRRDALINAGHQREFDMYVVPPPTGAPAPPGDTSHAVDAGGEAPTPTTPPAHSPSLLPRTSSLPPLRVVGQVGALYIIAEGPDGMFLIDQHAAHERIMYEKFLARRYGMVEGDVARQQLLEPLTLHVGSRLAGLVAAHLEELQHVGFAIEPFGGDTFLVRAVPGVLAGEDPVRVLEEIAASLGDRRNLVGEELEDQLVKMVCKRAAIKAGQQLSDIEMQELVRQLEQCQSPRTCPHGRPTMIQLSASELEKAFGRT